LKETRGKKEVEQDMKTNLEQNKQKVIPTEMMIEDTRNYIIIFLDDEMSDK
jgi:hypothetical protein